MSETDQTDVITPERQAFLDAAPRLGRLSLAIDRVVADVPGGIAFGLSDQELVRVARREYEHGPGAGHYELTVGLGDPPRDARRLREGVTLSWWINEDGAVDKATRWLVEWSRPRARITFPNPISTLPLLLGRHTLDESVEWFDPATHRVVRSMGPHGPELSVVPRRRWRWLGRRAASAAAGSS